MQNIREILEGAGVEVEAGKLAEIEKAVLANYRSKAEAEAKAAKVAELEQRLAEADAAIEAAKQADVTNAAEVEEMRGKLEAYEKADEERRAKADEDKARAEFDEKLAGAVGEKSFANGIVAEAVKDKAFKLAKANPDMDIAAVLASVVGDTDGVWANPQRAVHKMPAGGSAAKPGTREVQGLEDLRNMSVDEIRSRMAEVDEMLASQPKN